MNQSTKRNIPRWLLPVILMVIGLTVGAGLTLALQGNGVLPNHVSGIVSEVSGQLSSGESDAKQTVQELYDAAVKDAVFADKDEIMPLITLTKEDSRVTWNDAGDRVLLLTWHNYPDSYPAGRWNGGRSGPSPAGNCRANTMPGKLWSLTGICT